MPEEDLSSSVEAIQWFHTIDLGNGIVTKGIEESPVRVTRLGLPDSFAGRSVLDVGAWDGFYSFEAERRGASRVVAADWFCWNGPGWGTKQGFELARRTLRSRVEDVDIDVMDLSPERIGMFDVVLFLGVLYHLRDPLGALERVASVTRDLLILETVVDMVGVRRPAAAFYPGTELSHDSTNWWAPNVPAMHGMLKAVGFNEIRTITRLPGAPFRVGRALKHWAAGKNGFNAALRQDRAVFHARRTGR
ncbi:MAG TPA: DUF1698 domain-containing protein [Vicinamibacterales bacterium]|nr:DUF1698 domain-containing protein [Vicinamibacterales bacterium]